VIVKWGPQANIRMNNRLESYFNFLMSVWFNINNSLIIFSEKLDPFKWVPGTSR